MQMTPTTLGLPYTDWHPGQWDTITDLIVSDKKYVLLQAPTGSGKSGLVKAYASFQTWDCLVLTGQKQLQDQYKTTLEFIDVRGRGNFPCIKDPVTADNAVCTMGQTCKFKTVTRHLFLPPEPHEGCYPCDTSPGDGSDHCPYYFQRYRGEFAQYAVLNYAYWLTMANYTGSYRKKDLMVFDEAHTLEDEVRRFATVMFSRRSTDFLDLPACYEPIEDIELWQLWARDCRSRLAPEYFKIQKNLAGPVTGAYDEQRRKLLMRFVQNADTFCRLDAAAWVGDLDARTGRAEFKPIWVAGLMHDLVWRHTDQKVILMSGTILDPKIFCNNLGLDPDDVEFVDVPSTFPVERRPFYYSPTMKGSYRDDDHVKQVVAHIDAIIDRHGEEKGIIHTVSHALAGRILKYSRHTRRMITHETNTKAYALTLFKRSTDGIWVSPSSTTGLDLPYDECLWQVIAKLPFPNKGDKQIKQLMKEGPDGRPTPSASAWYTWVTACALVQAYGRGMRAPDDRCTTYLIDPNWKWFRAAARTMFPQWFWQAVKNLAPQATGSRTKPTGMSVGSDVNAMLRSLGIGSGGKAPLDVPPRAV